MTPLRITATVANAVIMRDPLHLDGLLAWAVCQRNNIPPALTEEELVPVEIPVQRSECGRFHLCTASVWEAEAAELRYLNRRPVVAEMQLMGPQKGTMNISAGLSKGYHVPLHTEFPREGRVSWWCIGDREEIADLLCVVGYLSRRRAVGYGKVTQWAVEECEPWGDGFPVVCDGKPMRNLPTDYPGLDTPMVQMRKLTYPYWVKRLEEPCAVPSAR